MKTTVRAKTILYVDDDPDDRQLLHDALISLDSTVRLIFASNGIEALEKIAEMKAENSLPALIILDMNMPLLDGPETLQQLISDGIYPAIPVVLFTTIKPLYQEELSTGYNIEIIRKPFDLTSFRIEAKRLLEYCRK